MRDFLRGRAEAGFRLSGGQGREGLGSVPWMLSSLTKPPVANTRATALGRAHSTGLPATSRSAFGYGIRPATRHRAKVEHGPAEGHDSSPDAPGMRAGNLNSSALNDVRRHASPISRDAGAASGASDISAPWAIRAATESRGARATSKPAATICTDVRRLLASNVFRSPGSIPPNQ